MTSTYNKTEHKKDLKKLGEHGFNFMTVDTAYRIGTASSKEVVKAKHFYKTHLIQLRKKYGPNPIYECLNNLILSNNGMSLTDIEFNERLMGLAA